MHDYMQFDIKLCDHMSYMPHIYIHAGASFARDFLEIEQNRRSDINFAYDITEFTSKLSAHQLGTLSYGLVAL